MPASRSILTLLLLGIASACGAEEAPPRIRGADFPSVTPRAAFFEERINAADAATRRRVLLEVGYFFDLPDADYVAFLRRMMRDPDPVIRGQAVHKLHDMWVPVELKDLPQTFAGYHDRQIIDLEDPKTVPGLAEACRGGSVEAGYAAYVLGLLRHKQAVPDLRKLSADGNVFVRYSAARALIDCGDPEGARPILDAIIRPQLDLYAAGGDAAADDRQPYYAAVACRAFAELGPKDKAAALDRLIALTGFMERSAVPNDEAHLPYVRQVLAAVAGKYFVSEAEARKWYEGEYGRPKDGVVPRP